MATAPLDTPANHDAELPNHMIMWLDATIGDPKEYINLKRAFGNNADPRFEAWIMLTDKNYHTLLAEGDAVTVTFEGVRFLLQAFDNEADCLKAFEENQNKRIFFITSGAMGQSIVPKIIERHRNIFTDPITDKPYPSVYVFCHNIGFHVNWAMDYREYIQMFNFDSELLERMTRDIAEYFIERGKRIEQDNDLKGALQRLHWAKRLWHQYDKMDQQIPTDQFRPVRESKEMKEINKLIAEIEAKLPEETSDEHDTNNDEHDTNNDEHYTNNDDDDDDDDDVRPSEPCS